MTQQLANYDPNIKWVKQKVELTLQMWNYTRTEMAEVGGNCFGFNILETAVGNLYETLLPDDERAPVSIVLTSPDGEELHCEDDEERGEEWLKDMVVCAKIIEQPLPESAIKAKENVTRL